MITLRYYIFYKAFGYKTGRSGRSHRPGKISYHQRSAFSQSYFKNSHHLLSQMVSIYVEVRHIGVKLKKKIAINFMIWQTVSYEECTNTATLTSHENHLLRKADCATSHKRSSKLRSASYLDRLTNTSSDKQHLYLATLTNYNTTYLPFISLYLTTLSSHRQLFGRGI